MTRKSWPHRPFVNYSTPNISRLLCQQHVIVGTPGRLLALIKSGDLKLGKVKHFIIDECDKVLEEIGMSLPRYFNFVL